MSHYKVLITQIVYPHKFILFFFIELLKFLLLIYLLIPMSMKKSQQIRNTINNSQVRKT